MKKLLHISVLTTHKFRNRQKNVLDTWMTGFDDYVFYTDKITDVGNQISVCDDNSYDSAAVKQVEELLRIKNSNLVNDYDWFLFCDDDSVININLLKTLCSSEFLPIMSVGKMGNSWRDGSLWYYSGGAGFLIRSELIKNCSDIKFTPEANFSDVQVGLWLNSNGIKLNHDSRFNSHDPKFVNKENEIKNQISFHYIKNYDDMNNITKRFLDV